MSKSKHPTLGNRSKLSDSARKKAPFLHVSRRGILSTLALGSASVATMGGYSMLSGAAPLLTGGKRRAGLGALLSPAIGQETPEALRFTFEFAIDGGSLTDEPGVERSKNWYRFTPRTLGTDDTVDSIAQVRQRDMGATGVEDAFWNGNGVIKVSSTSGFVDGKLDFKSPWHVVDPSSPDGTVYNDEFEINYNDLLADPTLVDPIVTSAVSAVGVLEDGSPGEVLVPDVLPRVQAIVYPVFHRSPAGGLYFAGLFERSNTGSGSWRFLENGAGFSQLLGREVILLLNNGGVLQEHVLGGMHRGEWTGFHIDDTYTVNYELGLNSVNLASNHETFPQTDTDLTLSLNQGRGPLPIDDLLLITPPNSGTSGPVTPPNSGTSGPVTPPNSGTSGPVTPPTSGSTSPTGVPTTSPSTATRAPTTMASNTEGFRAVPRTTHSGFYAVPPTTRNGFYAVPPTTRNGFYAVPPTTRNGFFIVPATGTLAPTTAFWTDLPTTAFWTDRPTTTFWSDRPTTTLWVPPLPTTAFWAPPPSTTYWTNTTTSGPAPGFTRRPSQGNPDGDFTVRQAVPQPTRTGQGNREPDYTVQEPVSPTRTGQGNIEPDYTVRQLVPPTTVSSWVPPLPTTLDWAPPPSTTYWTNTTTSGPAPGFTTRPSQGNPDGDFTVRQVAPQVRAGQDDAGGDSVAQQQVPQVDANTTTNVANVTAERVIRSDVVPPIITQPVATQTVTTRPVVTQTVVAEEVPIEATSTFDFGATQQIPLLRQDPTIATAQGVAEQNVGVRTNLRSRLTSFRDYLRRR